MRHYFKNLPLYKKILLIFIAAFISLAVLLSFLIMYGKYWTTILGEPWALVYDPGGWYFPSGAYFFRARYPSFYGHPGLVLELIIGLVTELAYFVATIGKDIPYPNFFIKNYPSITIAVSIILSLLNIPLFYLIYKLAEIFSEEKIYPTLSVLAFGTTFTTLLYINRVSPDVICTLLIVLSVYALLQALKLTESGKTFSWFTVLASVAITTALFSKLVYGGPAYVAILLFLVFYKNPSIRQNPAIRTSLLKWFIPVSFVTALTWSLKFDYVNFLNSWFYVADKLSGNYSDKLMTKLLNHPNISMTFLICEWLYLVIVAFGFKNMLVNRSIRQKPETVLLTLVFLFSMPMQIVKMFVAHYMFVPLAIGAIPFSYQIRLIFEQYFSQKITLNRKLMAGIVLVIAMHSMSFYTAATSHLNSITASRQKSKPLYAALRDIGYDEKIAVNGPLPKVLRNYMIVPQEAPEPIHEAFYDYFIFAKSIRKIPPDQGVSYFVDVSDAQTTAKKLK